MANVVRIKRRTSGGAGAPSSLANAELAYNEVDDILYYGKGTGGAGGTATTIIPIGGPGGFVGLTGAQTIAGVKTFSSSPVLPTPITQDNSTNGATTAFVKAQGYITGNQTITVSGDASGSGTTAITLTLGNSGVTAGTYNNSATQHSSFTVDQKGRITAVGAATTITPAWSSITSKPTTLSGFGITDAYTKTETDTLLQGLNPKGAVRVATTANITLSGTQTIDGVAVVAGDRVLVKDQTTPSQNGIYVVAAGAWSRAVDMNTWAEVPSAYLFAQEGTTWADVPFVCTSNAGGTLDTTAITFMQFNGAGSITVSTGLVKSGNTLSVSTELAGYHNNAVNGIITRTAAGTITGRTITVGGNGISVTNANGVAGNPLISLNNELSSIANLGTVGIVVKASASGNYITSSISTAGGVTVQNFDGSLGGSITIGLTNPLSAISGLTPAANQVAYYTGASTSALMTVTSFARNFLTSMAADEGRGWLSLGTISTQNSNAVQITGGSITNLTTFDGITVDCGTY